MCFAGRLRADVDSGAGYNPGYEHQQGQQPPYSGGGGNQDQAAGQNGQGFQYSKCKLLLRVTGMVRRS